MRTRYWNRSRNSHPHGAIARTQCPQYQVIPQPDGALLVKRPGQADAPVDVNDIARFCRRGPKDCNYATDKVLLELRGGK